MRKIIPTKMKRWQLRMTPGQWLTVTKDRTLAEEQAEEARRAQGESQQQEIRPGG